MQGEVTTRSGWRNIIGRSLLESPSAQVMEKSDDNQSSQKSTGGFCHVINLLYNVVASHRKSRLNQIRIVSHNFLEYRIIPDFFLQQEDLLAILFIHIN